jgi:hypothetical protein
MELALDTILVITEFLYTEDDELLIIWLKVILSSIRFITCII